MKLECTDTKENQLKLLEIKMYSHLDFFLISTEGRNSQRENAIKERLYELEYVS